MNKGFLLVIEGIDGSGKTTQVNLLKKNLTEKNIPFEVISFPQYGENEYADKIYNYLSGKLGRIEVHELAKIYADDRKTVRDLIKDWLKSRKLVIANRYVSSSKAHLGANLSDEQLPAFIKWIDDLEYQINEMPKEDLTILLNVDPKVGQKNSQIKDHPDLHEDNLKHLELANQIFFHLSQTQPNCVVVDCMDDSDMKSPSKIHNEIINILKSKVF